MKVIVDVVVSLNGFIARDNGDEDWLPEAGWDEFLKQIDRYKNCIIGRETYELVKEKYEHDNFDEIQTKLKVIVSQKKGYSAGADYRIANSPEQAVHEVEKVGLDVAYVGGGGRLITSFFETGLVDEIRVTTVPYIISSGRPFLHRSNFEDVRLKLLESEQHADGSLTNVYKVMK